ncbi:hypothetical protein [Bacillus wiedmannii]|uniref:hypothetical protein n=1 Tax=Bacillus wiedmannii TaxID=1890302 RepID=UPI000BF15D7C|nr:hypothetical protein [Bacillus wiedmannii]PEM10778.1 hypothetical protein CN610_12705 [Bacillus wiedmannii]PEQ01503.1 hypothetical protein CN587_25085 [Bacillus wiedmannii]
MHKKLRVLQVVIQPILVWDDGEELTPFEKQAVPLQIPLSELEGLADKIKNEVKQVEEQFQEG